MTDNHDYNRPREGERNWHEPLNENFAALDADVEVRDLEARRDQYDPKDGAKFLSTDTGTVYLGDGDDWNSLGTIRRLDGDVLVGPVEPEETSAGTVWVDPDRRTLRVHDGDGFVPIAPPTNRSAGNGSVIEGFEGSDGLAAYRGNTASFSIDTDRSTEGAASLRVEPDHDGVIVRDGAVCEVGETYRIDVRAQRGTWPKLYYLSRGASLPDLHGYAVGFDVGRSCALTLERVDGGGLDDGVEALARRSVPAAVRDIDSWVTIEVAVGFDGTHAAKLKTSRLGTVTSLAYDTWHDDVRYATGEFGFGSEGSAAANWDALRIAP